jgi:hypothetical protein
MPDRERGQLKDSLTLPITETVIMRGEVKRKNYRK